MYETAYPLDTAAEILECQQKKIMSEWAKETIRIVLDFGVKDSLDADSFYDGFSYGRITPWNAADISAPATAEYLPEVLMRPDSAQLMRARREAYHEYSEAGFYFDNENSSIRESNDEQVLLINVLLYGFWAVPYSEFSRLHVQESFTLHPYSNTPAFTAVAAKFTPGNGTRKINAPEKKNLRITKSDMAIMRKLLSGRPNHQHTEPPATEQHESAKIHGGIERFALEREKILAAALYVAHHFPRHIGKTFKSHAECIDKHAYLFWKDEPAPDPARVAKILSDASRPPEQWKILGGNARVKK